jgi:hypothetical protein
VVLAGEDIVVLHSSRLPKPVCELLVVTLRVMDGIPTDDGATGRVETGELRIRYHWIDVKLDKPCVLLLDDRLCTGLGPDIGIVE